MRRTGSRLGANYTAVQHFQLTVNSLELALHSPRMHTHRDAPGFSFHPFSTVKHLHRRLRTALCLRLGGDTQQSGRQRIKSEPAPKKSHAPSCTAADDWPAATILTRLTDPRMLFRCCTPQNTDKKKRASTQNMSWERLKSRKQTGIRMAREVNVASQYTP